MNDDTNQMRDAHDIMYCVTGESSQHDDIMAEIAVDTRDAALIIGDKIAALDETIATAAAAFRIANDREGETLRELAATLARIAVALAPGDPF